ncbi:nucleotidyltransferase family protein [Lentzea sp. NPDC102401]|uniref:nucleotidyltransferase family protein n=1 Tax=Lentzea sp. NPDC102401 TaxID=3364128 RepID=UPI0038257910
MILGRLPMDEQVDALRTTLARNEVLVEVLRNWIFLGSTCLGVRLESNGKWRVYAPHGLADVFNLVVRPNPGARVA